MWFKNLFRKNNVKNEVEIQKKKNNFKKSVLVLGNGITDYASVECSQCHTKFTEFDFIYLKYTGDYQPCCPNCKADITKNTFYPLNKYNNRIT